MVVAALLSVLAHAVLVVSVVFWGASPAALTKLLTGPKVSPEEPTAEQLDPADEARAEAPEFEVAALRLEDAPPDVREIESTPEIPVEVAALPPEPEPEPESEPEPEPPPEPVPAPTPPLPMNRVAVDQLDSNEERPLDAEFVAEQDNVVLEQTIAEESVLFEESPESESSESESPDSLVAAASSAMETSEAVESESEENQEAERAASSAPAPVPPAVVERMAENRERSESETPSEQAPSAASAERRESEGGEAMATTRDDTLAGPTDPEEGATSVAQTGSSLSEFTLAAASARAIQSAQAASQGEHAELLRQMQPDESSYQDAFGERDQAALAAARREVAEQSFVGDHSGQAERIRGTLENFDANVATGTETHLTTLSDPFANYIHQMHNHIHPRWTEILIRWDLSYGATSSVSDRSLFTEIEYVIGRDGSMEDVRILRSAREPLFMQEAVAMAWSIGPLPPPPPGMLSSDGRTYIHWRFHRDRRQCGTFGASVHFLGPAATDEGK